MNKSLPWIYLLLAILGAILPWQANLEFMQMNPGGGFENSWSIIGAKVSQSIEEGSSMSMPAKPEATAAIAARVRTLNIMVSD